MSDNPFSVFISNEAINAQYDFTPTEMDIMALVIYKTQPSKPWTDSIVMYVNDIRTLKQNGSKAIYEGVKEALTGLVTKPYRIFDREYKNFYVCGFIASGEYEANTGKITITLTRKIHQLIVNIQREFTSFNVRSILMLKRKHAKRLYLLACQFVGTGVRNIHLDELRRNFGIQDRYPTFADLQRYVIQPAIMEINEKTELQIQVNPIKTGRSIDSLNIQIAPNEHIIYSTSSKDPAESEDLKKLRSRLVQLGLSDWQALNILRTLDMEQVNRTLYQFQLIRDKIQKPGPYLAKTFESQGVPMAKKMPLMQYRIDDMADEIAAVEAAKQRKSA
jgi:plasmid replication initiation protein